MKQSRRAWLQTTMLAGVPLSFAACEGLVSRVARRFGQSIPNQISVADGATIDSVFHLLSRAAYGTWPGDLERVRALGIPAWIEDQLAPEGIDDSLCDLRARRFETLHHAPGTCYEYRKPVLREEIARHTLLRAVYSRRQLFEVMVSFWSDHFNINIEKGDAIYLKPADDRLVIRAHALGRFSDLVRASATSPAMLVYLDGKENKKAAPSDVPNENYARELLELHTLGVRGGYTQSDVTEVARCLTGWRLRSGWGKGTVYFDESLHDDGEKRVLGHTIPAGLGAEDLARVVRVVCQHPSTARYIATKLVRRFVGEEIPESLVARVASLFTDTGGDIKSLVRLILTSEEFAAAKGAKLKQPFRYVVSALRAVGADTHAHQPLIEYLMRMGQGLFQHPTPDGYPDEAASWLGTFLWRWNFAFALAANKVPSVKVSPTEIVKAIGGTIERGLSPDRLLPHFIGRAGTASETGALHDYIAGTGLGDDAHRAELFGLILASPAFQKH